MKLHLTATPEELRTRGPELLEQLAAQIEAASPEAAAELRKARREPGLKYQVLRDLHTKTGAAYRKQLDAMLLDVGKVLDRTLDAPSIHKSLTPADVHDLVKALVKAEMEELQKGEDDEDEDDDDAPEPGDVDIDTGKLIPTEEEKQEAKEEKEEEGDDAEKSLEGLEKAGPFIGPRGGKWADAKHTIPWKEEKKTRTGLIEVPDAKVKEVADAILANVEANRHGVIVATKPGYTTTTLKTPKGEELDVTVFYMPREDIKDPRGIKGSSRTVVRPGLGGESSYVDSTTIRVEAKPGAASSDLDSLKALVRNVLSHEMAHAVDPSIIQRSLRAAEQAMVQDDASRERGSSEAKTYEEYLNLPTEVTARMQQIARDILDVKSAAEIKSAWDDHQSNPEEMPPPYRPEDVVTWSPTWEIIEAKLTPKNRQRILKMAARVVGGIQGGTIAAVKKSLGGIFHCDFDRLEKAGPFVGPRGGKWADAAHTIPWVEEQRHAKIPETIHHTTPERQQEVEHGLQRNSNAFHAWENGRLENPTRYATVASKTLLETTGRLAGQLRSAKEDGRKEDQRKWQSRYDEARGEIGSRKRYYDLAREKVALEEAKTTGVLTLSHGEVSQLIGGAGDAYVDAGHRGGYAPELFKTSDLSGMQIRHYVKLPDGRIAHPDEIHEAQVRGRVQVVDHVKVPALDWTQALEGVAKSLDVDEALEKAGPFVGPRGGRWKDAAHTIPWKDPEVPAARQLSKLSVGPLDEDQVAAQTDLLAQYPRANLEEFLAKVEGYQRRLGDKVPASLERWHRATLAALQRVQEGVPDAPTAPAEPEATGGLTVAEPHKPKKKAVKPVDGGEPTTLVQKMARASVLLEEEYPHLSDAEATALARRLQDGQAGRPGSDIDAAIAEAEAALESKAPKPKRKVKRGKAVRAPQLELKLPERKPAEKKKQAKRKPVKKREERKTEAKPKAKPKAKAKPKTTEPEAISGGIEQAGDHIWGSRKDLEDLKAITSSDQLEGMSFEDAARVVTKAALVPPHDLQTLRGLGMTPGGAHIALALLASIRAKPGDTTAERAAYIDRVHEVLGGLKNAKTAEDIQELINEYSMVQMRAPKWAEVERVPQDTKALRAKVDALEKQNPKAKYGYRTDHSRGQFVIVARAPKPYGVLGTQFGAFIKGSSSKAYKDARSEAMTADGTWDLGPGTPKTAEEGWKYLEERGREKNEGRKQKAKATAKKRKPGVSVTQSVAGEVERRGHTVDVPDANPDRARSTFNLKEIDFGQKGWMSQADREYHVKALEGALHDFSETLKLDPHTLSLGGRIGIAMGARGRGKASAHFESSTKAINITRFRGNGTLAHEWGHALDNIMAEHFNEGSDKKEERFLSESPGNQKWPPEIRTAIEAVHEALTKHPDPEEAKTQHRRQLEHLAGQRDSLVKQNNDLVQEHRALSGKIKPENVEASVEGKRKRIAEYKSEIAEIDAFQESRGGKLGGEKETHRATLKYWSEKEEKRVAGLESGELVATDADNVRMGAIKEKIEDLRLPINRATAEHKSLRSLDPLASNYLRSSRSLGEYWRRPREMFARAFEGFVQDAVENHGRRNSYLVDGTRNAYQIQKTEGGPVIEPWPQGKERKRINEAMGNLLKVLSVTGALRKALRTFDGDPALVLRKAKPKEDLAEPLAFDPTKPRYDQDEKRYDAVKVKLEGHGYKAKDFESGGKLDGQSVNELMDLLDGLKKKDG